MTAPPVFAERLLAELARDDRMRAAMLGDFEEEFQDCCRRFGAEASRAWYWRAVLSSVPPLAADAVRQAGAGAWIRATAALAAGLVLLALLLGVADVGMTELLRGVGYDRHGAVGLALALVIGVLASVAAGRLTARLARPTPIAITTVAAMVLVTLNVSAAAGGVPRVPVWYWLFYGLILAVGMVLGAGERRRPPLSQRDTPRGLDRHARFRREL